MVKIAIVEDEKSAADELSRFLGEYYEEKGGDYRVDVYGDALSFLAAYDGYDVVFMDIELPDYDGMRAAKKLRDTDDTVIIVFVTNMRSFAVEGYKVGALDFVMKPVGRPVLRSLLRKVDRILLRTRGSKVTVKTWGGGIKLLDADEIYYVEVARHHLVFHTEGGELDMYGDLVGLEKTLPAGAFARCNNCYLVNLRYVTDVRGDTVTVAGEELKMSRPKKKDFLLRLAEFHGGRA